MKRIHLQLFVVTTCGAADWVKWLREADLSYYEEVNILVWGEVDELNKYLRLLTRPNYHLHHCSQSAEWHMNELIDRKSDYYAIVSRPSDFPVKLPEAFVKYFENGGKLALIRPGDAYNNGVAFTELSTYLCNFGEQDVFEKLSIYCQNYGLTDVVYDSTDEFLAVADRMERLENGTL